MWREIMVQTLPYAAASAVGIIYFREALVLTQALSTAHQAGYYSAAFRIVDVLGIMPYQLVLAGFPILARAAFQGNDDRLRYALQRFLDVSWLVGIWVVICIYFGAKFGIAVIAGPGYRHSVPILQIQGISVLATFIVAVYSTVMLSVRHSRDLLVANALAVVVATVLSVTLIPHFRADGAAVAAVAAEASLAAAYAYLLHRRRPDLHVSLKILPRVLLAAAVPAAITALAPIPSVGRLVLFTVLYAGASWLLRTIPVEVVNALLRRSSS
jgi:O-antigen/teichoic acid export membrane protein